MSADKYLVLVLVTATDAEVIGVCWFPIGKEAATHKVSLPEGLANAHFRHGDDYLALSLLVEFIKGNEHEGP